jgi:hypothetical protein
MINERNIAEILSSGNSAQKDIKLTLKVHPFHTDSLTYSPRERAVYHDRSDCVHGQRIKQDGYAIPGTEGRQLCSRCADLNAGLDDFFPGDEGA